MRVINYRYILSIIVLWTLPTYDLSVVIFIIKSKEHESSMFLVYCIRSTDNIDLQLFHFFNRLLLFDHFRLLYNPHLYFLLHPSNSLLNRQPHFQPILDQSNNLVIMIISWTLSNHHWIVDNCTDTRMYIPLYQWFQWYFSIPDLITSKVRTFI